MFYDIIPDVEIDETQIEVICYIELFFSTEVYYNFLDRNQFPQLKKIEKILKADQSFYCLYNPSAYEYGRKYLRRIYRGFIKNLKTIPLDPVEQKVFRRKYICPNDAFTQHLKKDEKLKRFLDDFLIYTRQRCFSLRKKSKIRWHKKVKS